MDELFILHIFSKASYESTERLKEGKFVLQKREFFYLIMIMKRRQILSY